MRRGRFPHHRRGPRLGSAGPSRGRCRSRFRSSTPHRSRRPVLAVVRGRVRPGPIVGKDVAADRTVRSDRGRVGVRGRIERRPCIIDADVNGASIRRAGIFYSPATAPVAPTVHPRRTLGRLHTCEAPVLDFEAAARHRHQERRAQDQTGRARWYANARGQPRTREWTLGRNEHTGAKLAINAPANDPTAKSCDGGPNHRTGYSCGACGCRLEATH